MSQKQPTQLPGDKMRKAIEEFCRQQENNPELTRAEIIERVNRKFDLSPLECDFLLRHLDSR